MRWWGSWDATRRRQPRALRAAPWRPRHTNVRAARALRRSFDFERTLRVSVTVGPKVDQTRWLTPHRSTEDGGCSPSLASTAAACCVAQRFLRSRFSTPSAARPIVPPDWHPAARAAAGVASRVVTALERLRHTNVRMSQLRHTIVRTSRLRHTNVRMSRLRRTGLRIALEAGVHTPQRNLALAVGRAAPSAPCRSRVARAPHALRLPDAALRRPVRHAVARRAGAARTAAAQRGAPAPGEPCSKPAVATRGFRSRASHSNTVGDVTPHVGSVARRAQPSR